LNEKTKGILADTTVWIEFFRTRSKTGDTLESLIREGRFGSVDPFFSKFCRA